MKKMLFKHKPAYFLLTLAILNIPHVRAASINAASCSQADVQASVNKAVNGDIVNIPAGSCNWTSTVSWKDKNISVIGAGIDITSINTSTAFDVQITKNPASFRISNMTLTGATPTDVITIDSSGTTTATKGWRIDHMRFNYSNDGLIFPIRGITWGLIDNSTFDGPGYAIASIFGFMKNCYGNSCPGGDITLAGEAYWNRPLNLGSDEAVYLEDLKINNTIRGFVFDLQYGGSAVLRNSTIRGNYFITHSARTSGRGGMKYEVYNNTFNGNGTFRVAQLRSGTGVIFNNTISGYDVNHFDVDNQRNSPQESGCVVTDGLTQACNGSNSFDGNIESNGWPCLDQVGRGSGGAKSQANEPLYAWNNGSTATCAAGGSCNNSSKIKINGACPSSAAWIKTSNSPHNNGQFDYINNGSTPKPGYIPYIYPHPLQSAATGGGNGTTTILPPTNLIKK